MNTYNDIGIDSKLDWKRIAKLFRIGLFAGRNAAYDAF